MTSPEAAERPSSPSSPRRATVLALLLAVLAVCSPPLIIGLGDGDSLSNMEQLTLMSSRETWQRVHDGESLGWLIPTDNGVPRVFKPPLVVWLNLLAWTGLDPATCDPTELIFRSRLLAASMALVLIAATFWLGLTLGDLPLAVLSALVAGTMIFLQRQGRMASYDIHLSAWSAMAVAAALWAIAPFRAEPPIGRRIAGWALTGFLTAVSLMSKSPLAIFLVAGPVLAAIALNRRRWRWNLAGLGAALVLCALLVAPWFIYTLRSVSGAGQSMLTEYAAVRDGIAPIFYYLGIFGWVAPWTLWLIGGLVHPLRQPAGDQRRRRLVAWWWFVIIIIAFSAHLEAKKQRYILPVVPAVAILAAQVLCMRPKESMADRLDTGHLVLAHAHWTALSAVSLAAVWLLAWPQSLPFEWRWSIKPAIAALPWPAALSIGAVLLAISAAGWRWHARHQPWRAGVMTALWAIVFTTPFWYAEAIAPSYVRTIREDARFVSSTVGSGPLMRLVLDKRLDPGPAVEFRFYLGRIIPPVHSKDLGDLAQRSAGPVYVLARQDDAVREVLRSAGFHLVREVHVDSNRSSDLWASGAPSRQ